MSDGRCGNFLSNQLPSTVGPQKEYLLLLSTQLHSTFHLRCVGSRGDCRYSDWSRAPNRLPRTVHKFSLGISNSGHTKQKVWQGTSISSAKYAFLKGFSTGLIVVHIGNEKGFVHNGLRVFNLIQQKNTTRK